MSTCPRSCSRVMDADLLDALDRQAPSSAAAPGPVAMTVRDESESVQRLQKLGLQKAPDDLTVSAALLLAKAAASCSSGGAVDKIVSSLSCIAALVSAVLSAPSPPSPGAASLTAAHAAAALAAVASYPLVG